MELTLEEMDRLEKMLGRMEKQARKWRVTRWMMLVFGVLFLSLSLYAGYWARATLLSAVPTDIDHFSLVTGYMAMMFLTMLMFQTYVMVMMAVGAATFAAVRWRRGERDLLLIKLARSVMDRPADGQDAPPDTAS